MKNLFGSFVAIFLLVLFFTSASFPQAEITFRSPTEGQVITLLGNRSSVEVNVLFGIIRNPYYGVPEFVRLIAPPYGFYQSNLGNGVPQWISVTPGTYHWTFELYQSNNNIPMLMAQQSITFQVKFLLTLENCFTGGDIIVDGNQRSAPATVKKFINENVSVTAVEPQANNGYNLVWNTSSVQSSDWTRIKYQGPTEYFHNNNKSINYTVESDDNGSEIIANLKRLISVGFQNNFVGLGNGGTIIINGTQYNSPANGFAVVEQNPIRATAQDQTINGIDYMFIGWYNGNELISNERTNTFNPGNNISITAKFQGTPNVNSMNAYYNYQLTGQHPTIFWTDNVNTNVSYKIYRSVLDGYIWSSWSLVRSVSKGVQSYTDNSYIISGKSSDYQLRLDASYSIENTATTAHYCMFGANARWLDKNNLGKNQTVAISEYKLYDNYPNPFNPSTEISYQIPSDGNVKLKVFNMMGQEIMTLVNAFKEAGMYNVKFNAGNLASGIYIYKLEAGNFVQVKKMLLTK